MKKLTLIGGAPVSGKTTLSRDIAKQDGGVELSTDSVRSWMKQLVTKDEYKDLFCTSGFTAEQFYETYDTAQKVVDEEVAEGLQVEKGIEALLETAVTWEHLILEGIALSPEFMRKLEAKYVDREIEMIVLVDEDEERILERISKRGLWGPLDTYPSSLISTEAEWVVLYNQWFKMQAKAHNLEPRYVG